jgi:serine phosphatase RsbU (regulator of sigma subunit)
MLGVLDDATYMDGVAHLEPGDGLMFYTDGVTEAENASGEFFTETRLRSVLEGASARPVGQLVAEVLSSVQTFTEGLEQGDDITLLAVRFRPAAGTVECLEQCAG